MFELRNAYQSYEELLFAAFDGAPSVVVSAVQTAIRREPRYRLSRIDLDLRYAYLGRKSCQTERDWSPSQLLFWSPVSDRPQTVMMCNSGCGHQPHVSLIAKHLPFPSAFFAFRDKCCDPPTCYFDYYAPYATTSRHLATGEEDNGRRRFWSTGPVQDFEEPEEYKKRRIHDRLSRGLLTRYAQRLGFDIASDAFWSTDQDAWLIWDDVRGFRDRPGRDGVDEGGTRLRRPEGYVAKNRGDNAVSGEQD